jgi:hypothetical protein
MRCKFCKFPVVERLPSGVSFAAIHVGEGEPGEDWSAVDCKYTELGEDDIEDDPMEDDPLVSTGGDRWIVLDFKPTNGCLKGETQEIGIFGYTSTDPKDFARALKYIAMVLENETKSEVEGNYSIRSGQYVDY